MSDPTDQQQNPPSVGWKQEPLDPELIQAILKRGWKGDMENRPHIPRKMDNGEDISLRGPALWLATDIMQCFVEEAVMRSIKVAKETPDKVPLDVEHLEKILAQLLLDF